MGPAGGVQRVADGDGGGGGPWLTWGVHCTSRRARKPGRWSTPSTRKRRVCGAAPTLSGGQFVASVPEGGSIDHPSRRRSPSLDRKGQGDADPQARRRRSRPADRSGVRSRPGERDGSIAEARPEAVDPEADERGPQGSQHRARDSALTSRRGRRRARTRPRPRRRRRGIGRTTRPILDGRWSGFPATASGPSGTPSPNPLPPTRPQPPHSRWSSWSKSQLPAW
jgi:hypothetical protein